MAKTDILSIGVFIDGGYYAKINEGFKTKGMGLNVNVKALLSYIPEMIGKEFGIDRKLLYITEAHYYRGRYRTQDAIERNLLKSEREFEDTLIENDIIFHYKHLRESPNGGVIEKGIDTWFALDTYEMTLFREFDYVVLISGDADHEMLARKLKALKTHTILLTWDPANTGSTSRFLSEEACTHVDMNRMTTNDATLLKRLTTPAK
ncbi:MAG: NYN domain-containing protein [Bacteroidales bacterium]|nr:NYN domain-containing protein [Bacteroidales bacterium]